jgi:phosphatidylinositol phospholipase C delta
MSYIIPEHKISLSLPLTDYYCFSSHNTYLTGNQLTSDCKVSRYIEDLRKGIKCVELDVHNSNQ